MTSSTNLGTKEAKNSVFKSMSPSIFEKKRNIFELSIEIKNILIFEFYHQPFQRNK